MSMKLEIFDKEPKYMTVRASWHHGFDSVWVDSERIKKDVDSLQDILAILKEWTEAIEKKMREIGQLPKGPNDSVMVDAFKKLIS